MSKVTPVSSASSVKKSSKPAHPTTSAMVMTAVETLAERNGSSVQAIKKFLAKEYDFDVDNKSHLIKKFLKGAVATGVLIQTTGKGASGSFKLPKASKSKTSVHREEQAPEVRIVKKVKKVEKKPAAQKPVSPKKMAKSRIAVVESSSKAKSSKAKKSVKSPTAKPKTPKPKKTTSPRA